MKVLHLCKFYPPVRGGIETVAWELAEGAHAAAVDVAVLCANQRATTVDETAPSGYPVRRVASWGTVLSTSVAPTMPLHLARLARGRELVHLHMPDPMAALAFRVADPGARLVVHWHSDVIRQRRALALYEPLQRWILGRADAVVATSPPYAQSSVPLAAWQHKVAVVPIGIGDPQAVGDLDRTARAARAADLRRRHGDRRIVFALGRMTHYKGFEVLVEAAAALRDDCVVLVGGEGERLASLRATVRARGLEGRVHFLGHVSDADLPHHFAACDVFCMPSTVRAEAYGVAMLEAMAMGKPAVASDIAGSGVPWVNVNGETGLDVPPGDPHALAAALGRLLGDDALRRRMGDAARLRYLRHFTAADMTRQTTALYERVLQSPPARRPIR